MQIAPHVQAIEELPLVQTPEVFGLHANADIQYYTNATRELWRNLVELQPRIARASTGITREEFIGNVARDVLAKIPDPFDLPVIKKDISIPSPTQVVLLQEIERWNTYVPVLPLACCWLGPSAQIRKLKSAREASDELCR
jgi:dynein heavy chain, axonemal